MKGPEYGTFLPKQKSEEELRRQVVVSEQALENGAKEELIQPFSKENAYEMPIEEIKKRFPSRYETYLRLLRSEKSSHDILPDELEEIRVRLHMLNSLDLYIELHKSDKESRTLKEQQFTAFEDLREFMEAGGNEGYIKLPTGFGKTVIFTEFVEALNVKTLILVPKQLLVQQTSKKFSRFADTMDVGKVYANAKEHGKQVTVMTYQSLMAGLKNNTVNPHEYQCVILDEVHRALGKKTSEAIQGFGNILKIGFTATPDFAQDKQVRDLLGHEIHRVTLREAVESGMVSPFSVILAKTQVDLSNVSVKEKGRFDEKQLSKTVNVLSRNKAAVELYQNMFAGQSAIAYCSGIEHARMFADLLKQNGIPAEFTSGKQSMREKQESLDKFHSGEILVLCNADLLTEGFDEKRVTVCLNLRPTLSQVVAEQRGGRVLRIDENNPEKHAHIVDFVDHNAPNATVTFANVADGAIVTKLSSTGGGGGGSGGGTTIIPNIEGLQVIVDPEEVMRVVREREAKEYALQKKEGWESANSLRDKVSASTITISTFAEQFRSEHPEWFEVQKSKGPEAEHYHPDLVEKIIKHFSFVSEKKEGWESASSLKNKIHIRRPAILTFVRQFRSEHPEWFEIQMTGVYKKEHYHPDLVQKIIEHFPTVPKKREGWKTVNSLQKTADRASISAFVGQFRMEHPEWFEVQKTGVHKVEHLHPSLIKKVIEHFSSIPKIKEGWKTASSLGHQFSAGAPTILTFADQFRSEHPEWFEVQKTGSVKAEHYHPDLVAKIIEHFSSVPKKKEGWRSASLLSHQIHAGAPTILTFADQFRSEHPEWFEVQKTKTQKAEHYHPDLVAKITEHFSVVPKKKEWRTAHLLEDKTSADSSTILKFAEQFRSEHPEWFEMQKSKGPEAEHYHPDLVAKIIEHFSVVPKKKEGWESTNSLAENIGSRPVKISTFADQFRSEHPEWFEVQRTGPKKVEHYHPELVKKIKERFPGKSNK